LLFYFAHCAEKSWQLPAMKLGRKCFVHNKYILTTFSSEVSAEKEI